MKKHGIVRRRMVALHNLHKQRVRAEPPLHERSCKGPGRCECPNMAERITKHVKGIERRQHEIVVLCERLSPEQVQAAIKPDFVMNFQH